MRTFLTLAAICGVALLLRTVPRAPDVFRDGRVVFAGNDPWIHMRNAENIAAHWPWPSWFDPYRLAPDGQFVAEAPLMDIVIAGIALLTRVPLDLVGAWFPAIAGALIPIPLFFLTRTLSGDVEATIAAALVAIFPGSLLQRSLLGVADHHVLEALLAACVLLFLARARPLPSGLFLGLYLIGWSRGAFLLGILIAWALLARKGRLVAVTFAIAFVIAAPVAIHLPAMSLTLPILAGGAVAVLIAERLPRRAMPFVAAVLGVVAIALLPELASQLKRFLPAGGSATIGEAMPLLWSQGAFTLRPLWLELTTSSILMLIGFVFVVRERTEERMLVIVFAVVATAATLAQARFGYYMALAAAVLASVAATRLLWHRVHRSVAAIAIAAIVIYPNLPLSWFVAATPQPAPSTAWLQALDWMRVNTPEPFESGSNYTARYTSAANAPDARYGVMVWSDYGWWVSRIARRPPSTNPTHTAVKEAARFYTATTEREALALLDARRARYVIADRSMPMTIAGAGRIMASQLEVVARWAGKPPSQFYELAYDGGKPVFLYHPDYYRTMAIRLFAYGGGSFIPSHSSWAVALNARREIIDSRRFATFGEASAFVATDPKRWQLVGRHPLASCVPIEPLEFFTREFATADVRVYRRVE